MNNTKFVFWIKKILIMDFIYKLNLKNNYDIPKIKKITLFVDLNNNFNTSKQILLGLKLLTLLTNQKPNILRSKHNISGSKLRKGSILGCNVIISKKNISNFLNLLVFYILPQIKNVNCNYLNEKKSYSIDLSDFLILFSFFNKDLNFNNNNKIRLIIETNLPNLETNKMFLSSLQIPTK